MVNVTGSCLTFLLCVILLPGCGTDQQVEAAVAGTTSGLSAPIADCSTALNIWVDVTGSVDRNSRTATLENLAKQLPGVIAKYPFCKVRVYGFGQQAWIAQPKEFILVVPPISMCRDAQIPGDLRALKSVANKLREEAQEECLERRQRADDERSAQIRNLTPQLRDALLAVPMTAGGACTPVYDLLVRISKTGGHNSFIILSDSQETCTIVADRIATPANHSDVLLLLVPSNGDWTIGKSSALLFESRKARVLKIAPWVHVEPAFSDSIADLFHDTNSQGGIQEIR